MSEAVTKYDEWLACRIEADGDGIEWFGDDVDEVYGTKIGDIWDAALTSLKSDEYDVDRIFAKYPPYVTEPLKTEMMIAIMQCLGAPGITVDELMELFLEMAPDVENRVQPEVAK